MFAARAIENEYLRNPFDVWDGADKLHRLPAMAQGRCGSLNRHEIHSSFCCAFDVEILERKRRPSESTPRQRLPLSVDVRSPRTREPLRPGSCPSLGTYTAHEVGHRLADLVGAVFLDEMAPLYRHFGLGRPGTAKFPLPAD